MTSEPSIRRTQHAGPPAERVGVVAPTVHRPSRAKLADLATDLGQEPVVALSESLVLELTARQPYDATHGNIDVYMPARWDTSSNLIFMETIRQVGPSPGEWEGSAAYVNFKPPSAGTFLIVGNFTGYETTMHLHGPWGETTAYTALTSDSEAVLALWTGDQELWFDMNCTAPDNGYRIGYIDSIQVFAVA